MITTTHLRTAISALTTDEEDIQDLIWILDSLITLSKKLRSEIRIRKIEENTHSEEKQKRAKDRFNESSTVIYRYFDKLLKTGDTKPETMQHVKQHFNIGYYDAELFIAQGKRTEKLKRKSRPD